MVHCVHSGRLTDLVSSRRRRGTPQGRPTTHRQTDRQTDMYTAHKHTHTHTHTRSSMSHYDRCRHRSKLWSTVLKELLSDRK